MLWYIWYLCMVFGKRMKKKKHHTVLVHSVKNYMYGVLDELFFCSVNFLRWIKFWPHFPWQKKKSIIIFFGSCEFHAFQVKRNLMHFPIFAQSRAIHSALIVSTIISPLSTAYFRSIGTQIMTKSRAYVAALFAITKAK